MVQKLKAPVSKPKPPAYRMCTCGACGWKVAAPSLARLLDPLGAGWATACENERYAFICATCAVKWSRKIARMPHAQAFFDKLPAAPDNPFPCVGVAGHETSRPVDEETLKEPLQ